jgi:hypothetical protein
MSKEKKSCDAFNTALAVALFPKCLEVGMSGKYECILAFKKGSDGAKQILAEYKKAEAELYPSGIPANFAHMPLRDGDLKAYTNPETGQTEIRKGFEGCMYITAKSHRKPFLVDPTGKQAADPATLTHGSYVVANVNLYRWENSGKVGLTFGLNSVQVSSVKEDLPGGSYNDPLATYGALGEPSSAGGTSDTTPVAEGDLDAMFG